MTISDGAASRRGRGPVHQSGVINLAAEALKDIASLLQAELELLRAEIAEKLTFTVISIAVICAGALLLAATIVLLLQAAIAVLVTYGFSWPAAILIVSAIALAVGATLVWIGFRNLNFRRLAPMRTMKQVQKDTTIAKQR